MLKELLRGKIQIIEEVEDWEDAIHKSSLPLLENGSIEATYVNAMIQMCKDYNAYIVLMDNFAMPHASSDKGANKLDATLTIVRKPVDFMGKPVQVILPLSFIDNQSHLAMLQEVATLMGDESNLEQLVNAATIEEIEAIIKAQI